MVALHVLLEGGPFLDPLVRVTEEETLLSGQVTGQQQIDNRADIGDVEDWVVWRVLCSLRAMCWWMPG